MKEVQLANVGQVSKEINLSKQMRVITFNAVYLILGILVSKGTIFGVYSPFGAAFLAAVPYESMVSSLVGVVIGYILPSEINIGMRYISTVIAIAAIRWTLIDLKRVTNRKFYEPSLVFITTIATGVAANISSFSYTNQISMYITEAMLAAITSYFFKETIKALLLNKPNITISQSEFTYIAITVFIIMLSLSEFTIGYISVGKVIAVAAILFSAKYLGITGGSIAGIAAGIVFGLASRNPSYIAGAYSFGGLISSVAGTFGKFFCALSFLVSDILISMQTANPEIIISSIYEIVVGSIIFMLLPDSIGNRFVSLFYSPVRYKNHDDLKNSLIMRLEFASNALMNVSESINIVSEKLNKGAKGNVGDVYLSAIENICNNCGLRAFCFDTRQSDTIDSFKSITNDLKYNGEITKENFPNEFLKRCCRVNELAKDINQSYKEYKTKSISNSRVNEVREFVANQFSDASILISEIANEFEKYESFDSRTAEKIEVYLKGVGIISIDISCRLDKFNRMSIEIETEGKDKSELEKLISSKDLSRVCMRKFDLPCISKVGDRYRIQISERPIYDIQVGISQHSYKNGPLCGDNYTYFNDGMGRMIFILSDGMGTGGRAAVEGAMACQLMSTLIKSGIGFKTAVKVTNSALLVKSEDEFLATLDLICVDLFTGRVEMIKAGSPFTLIRKSGKIIRVDKPSLPIGILKDVNISLSEEKISKDDRILMISDGAISSNDAWIESEVKNWKDEDSQSFADRIVELATKKRENDFDDDITAITIKMMEYY